MLGEKWSFQLLTFEDEFSKLFFPHDVFFRFLLTFAYLNNFAIFDVNVFSYSKVNSDGGRADEIAMQGSISSGSIGCATAQIEIHRTVFELPEHLRLSLKSSQNVHFIK
jgi:hypothetical protein